MSLRQNSNGHIPHAPSKTPRVVVLKRSQRNLSPKKPRGSWEKHNHPEELFLLLWTFVVAVFKGFSLSSK
jgi:hypothetical protein